MFCLSLSISRAVACVISRFLLGFSVCLAKSMCVASGVGKTATLGDGVAGYVVLGFGDCPVTRE